MFLWWKHLKEKPILSIKVPTWKQHFYLNCKSHGGKVENSSFHTGCLIIWNCRYTSNCQSVMEAILLYLIGLSCPYCIYVFSFVLKLLIEHLGCLSKLVCIHGTSSPKLMSSIRYCRQELCPEKRMLYYPYLPKVIGSDFLERRLRDIHSNRKDGAACHVFGHTHFCWDSVVDEIRYWSGGLAISEIKMHDDYSNFTDIKFLQCRYVQAPLAYPRERKRRMNSEGWLPFCVYRDGFNPEIYPALWSDYYNKNKREPENTQLAPWVASHFAKYHKFHWPFPSSLGVLPKWMQFVCSGWCWNLHLPGKRTYWRFTCTWSFFLVSTLTITFGQVSASLCSLYVAEIWIMCIRFFKALLQR